MKKLLLIALFGMLFSGCLKSKDTCTYDECGRVAPDTEIQAVQNYLTQNGITATRHCSGLYYAVDVEGGGARPKICNSVTVNYEGKLTNGNVFDKTKAGEPATFGMSGVITGFTNGLMQIKSGGKIRLYIPPSLGYGSSASSTIPANSILIFTVEIVSVL